MRIIIEDVTPGDIRAFADVMSGRPMAALPIHDQPFFLPEPVAQPQRLLMPGPEPEVFPEPHPAMMPGYVPPTQVAEPAAKRPNIGRFAVKLVLDHKRQVAIAGLSLAGALFLMFAGSFVVKQASTEPTIEVGPVEAIGDGEVKGVDESAPEAEAEPEAPPVEEAPGPALNVPTFPLIPR